MKSAVRDLELHTGITVPCLVQGDADKPQVGYSLAEQAEDAAAVMDALEVQSASILAPRAAVTLPSSWQLITPAGWRR